MEKWGIKLSHLSTEVEVEVEDELGNWVHEGVQDSCNQCDQQVIVQTSLKPHEEVIHECVKNIGDQCDDQSLVNNRFGLHSESFHGGVTSVIKKSKINPISSSKN